MPAVSDDRRYGVVVCPRCRHAKGVDLTTATTTCGRCESRLKVPELRVFYHTGDPNHLSQAVGVVEAQVTGGDAGLLDLQALKQEIDRRTGARGLDAAPDPEGGEDALVAFAASRAAGVVSKAKKVDAVLDALDEHGPPEGFTQDMVESAFEQAGLPVERAEKELRRALVQDELFEPRPGRLKRL